MDDNVVISVKNVKKSFKIFYDKGNSLKEVLLFSKRRQYERRQVLGGISFDVKKGEAIGLIGHNGCGKSTMLKLLTRIMYPDSGSIEIKGRVSSLIELGAGFHPDMSGRENIYTNAAIFGLTRKEIDERIPQIIDFSEIEEFIDNPVRTYSSGMYMRLAFSVAINVDADVLLIDEILGVGDANFQIKCFNKLREIKSQGTTIVIVSHSLGQIEQICNRCLWLHDGLIRSEGDPKEVDMEYLDFMTQKFIDQSSAGDNKESAGDNNTKLDSASEADKTVENDTGSTSNRWGNKKATITSIYAYSEKGNKQKVFCTSDTIRFVLNYSVSSKVENAVFGIGIFSRDGVQCYGTNTRIDKIDSFSLEKDGSFEIILDKCSLLPGEYLIDFAIESGEGIPVDYFREAFTLEIRSTVGDVGICRIDHNWKI